jgi:RecA-family ATPase
VLDDDGTPKDPNGLAYMDPDEWRELVNRAEREADMALNDAPVAGVLASDVEREPVRWIWKGRLARGEMTILDGDPGLGNSTMLCELAARITTGRPLPGEEKPPRDGAGGVVLVTTEDSPSPTVRPRLDAAGADVGRVRIVPTVPTRGDDGGWDGGWDGGERVPKLPEDLDVLKATCRDVNADLLVIDPLLAHLSGEIKRLRTGT